MNQNLSPNLKHRFVELDVFRGFAIFGIFMVNILVMNVCFVYRGEWEAEQTGLLQDISFFVLENFFYSKFFAIFSLLFGMGVALQIGREKEKGTFNNSFFFRRFGSLFLFGVAHILFLWSGDILHLYGILGFLLLALFRLPARWLLWAAILVFLFPIYHILFDGLLEIMGVDYQSPLASISREEILNLKHNGSFLSGMQLRMKEWLFACSLIYSGIAPIALVMMLMGGYLVKSGFLTSVQTWLNKTKKPLFGALLVLFVYRMILMYHVVPNYEIEHNSPLSIGLYMLYQLSDISLSFSYLWLLGAAMQSSKLAKWFSPLRYVGQMALTNYILQSLLGYWIMRTLNGYESFSAFGCIVLVVVIFSLQIPFSKWWLSKFKFGPLEWFWRCISYWKWLPIKK